MAVLTFGLRSAPYIFNLFAEALHWIIQRHIPARLRHYLDDFFLLFSPDTPSSDATEAVQWVMALGRCLGLRFQDSKTVWPCHVIEFLGLILDSLKMEARLPEDKLEFLENLLSVWQGKKHCTLAEASELSGFLQFCSQVVPCSRTFMRRIFDFTASFRDNHFIRKFVPSGVRADLHWWLCFSRHWNGIRVIQPSFPTIHIYTDASGTKGLGGIWDSRWFSTRIARRHRSADIQYRELSAIVQAVLRWGDEWSGSHVVFHCDNQAVVAWLHSGRARSHIAMPLLRVLVMLAPCLHFSFSTVWLPTEENGLADAASRFQYQRLFDLGPHLFRQSSPTKSHLGSIKRVLTSSARQHFSSGTGWETVRARLTPVANDPISTS